MKPEWPKYYMHTCQIRREDVPDISQYTGTGQLVVSYATPRSAEWVSDALVSGGTTPVLVLNYIRYGDTSIRLAEIEYGVGSC